MKKLIPTGLRMPAEWEKQEAVWLQWPHEDDCHGYQMKLESIWLQRGYYFD